MIDLTRVHFQIAPDTLFATDRAGDPGVCSSCGRPLSPGSGYTVCVAEGGEILLDTKHWDDPEVVADHGYMGLFDIGPECARSIRRPYRAKRS